MPLIGGKNAKKKSSSSTTSKRHFTVVMGNKEHGLYISSSPSSAARKAVTKLCATDKKKKVQFSIREITQGSKKKTYGPYLGAIEKLDKPIELKGRVIKYKPVAKLLGKKTAKKSVVKKGGMRKMRGGAIQIEIESKFPKFSSINITKKTSRNGFVDFYIKLNNDSSKLKPIELDGEAALDVNFETDEAEDKGGYENEPITIINMKTVAGEPNPSYSIKIESSDESNIIDGEGITQLFSILEKVSTLPRSEYDNLLKQINLLNSTSLNSL